MAQKASIMVVEDESIIAMDIQLTLQRMGYRVPAVVPSGEQAIERVAEMNPDLVLMDIVLKGGLDGIQAAMEIRERYGTPVVYLTAHSDPPTLERAKVTEPLGYLIKPFEEHDLRSTIEMALYKHTMNRKLEDSERWLATTLQSISDAVIATDPQGRIRLMNGVAESLTGWTQAEALERPLAEVLRARAAATGPETGEFLRQTLIEGKTVRPTTGLTLLDRRGREHSIEVSVDPIKDAAGVLLGAVLVFRDITERRKLEEQAHQVRKLEAIGYLAGGVAHDFNNMLTVINGFSETLLAELPPNSSALVPLREIHRAGERAAGLTRQLLAFGRKQMLAPAMLDLNVSVAELEQLLRRLLGEHIEVVLRLDPHLGRIRADPVQLEEVLLNLVVNARDAMPAGGRLTLATVNVTFQAGTTSLPADVPPGLYVRLDVSDTGRGMDDQTRARLFEPFFTTKQIGKGAGLGLAAVYGIVKQSGGHIEVESAPGRGTTFRVYWPRHVESDQGIGAHPAAAAPRGKETVLLVEDEDAVRGLARVILATKGYQVLEAANGEEALRLSTQYQGPIDLVLTDVIMPQMGGRQLVDRLLTQRPHLKILYMSGYSADAVVRHGVQEGTMALLSKPFTPAALARKVREALDR